MTVDLASVPGGAGIIPVLTVPSASVAGPLADALTAGGARCAFRTADAEQVIKAMAAHGGLTVGAGTVLSPEEAERAVAAGARFVLSPGFDEEVVATCQALNVPGIDAACWADCLAEAAVVAVGGSWMATTAHVELENYAEIRQVTADAVERSRA
ncbi:hypothetical protein [Nonomuraea sp. NPDC049695]|uniref:hypothetical protein n=1 Tax=Nonomuraea sp. NPDC049695 TaxID=3154734 RepID=UPI003413C4D7